MGGGEEVGRDVSLNVSVVSGQPARQWVQPHDVCQYKLRKLFSMKNCKTVTSLSCVNQFFSFLTLLSCSDRSVRVLDLNQGTVVREIPHCHTRQVQPDVLQLQHCNW